jgi:hypothetical protein
MRAAEGVYPSCIHACADSSELRMRRGYRRQRASAATRTALSMGGTNWRDLANRAGSSDLSTVLQSSSKTMVYARVLRGNASCDAQCSKVLADRRVRSNVSDEKPSYAGRLISRAGRHLPI